MGAIAVSKKRRAADRTAAEGIAYPDKGRGAASCAEDPRTADHRGAVTA